MKTVVFLAAPLTFALLCFVIVVLLIIYHSNSGSIADPPLLEQINNGSSLADVPLFMIVVSILIFAPTTISCQ